MRNPTKETQVLTSFPKKSEVTHVVHDCSCLCVFECVCVWGGGVCEVREGRPLCYIPPCCSLTEKSSGLIFITTTRGLNSEVEGQAEFGRVEGRNTCVAMQGTLRSLLVLVCLNGVAAGTWRARLHYRVDWCVRSDYKT